MPRQVDKHGKPKGKPEFWLPSFEKKISTLCMPLGYSFDKQNQYAEPCINTKCDLTTCTGNGAFYRRQCFHTFHIACVSNNTDCPICTPYLNAYMETLSTKFNTFLVQPTKSKRNDVTLDQNDEECNGHIQAKPASYYKSEEWNHHIERTVSSFSSIIQPSLERKPPNFNQNNTRPPTQRKCSHCHQPGHTRTVNGHIACPQLLAQTQNPSPPNSQSPSQEHFIITYNNINSIKFWFFPHNVSQSTVNGRQGSTACALIALLMAKTYHINKSSLTVETVNLSKTWFDLMLSSVILGNQIHDYVFQHSAVTLQIPMAARLLRGTIGELSLGQELPVNFTSEGGPDTSNLEHYLKEMVKSTTSSIAIITTFRENTFTFVAGNHNNVIFMDSHLHEPYGALIASAEIINLPRLLAWIRVDHLMAQYNLCSITTVHF